MMSETTKKSLHLPVLAFFFVAPLLIWAMGDYPERTALKETLSVLTLLSFSLVLGLFYLARPNSRVAKNVVFRKMLNWHKYVGYCAVTILLVHPFLLVVPRYFEAGTDPGESFVTILTTFSSSGIIFGLIAWALMLLLGLTSFIRSALPMKYTTWRVLHGILALLAIFSAVFHVVDLGRHMDVAMAVYIVIVAGGGVYMLLHNYLNKK
jgi:predicted ferric reductase